MIEREVLKDIKDYKPKFIGPFTLRNFACGAIAIAVGTLVFLLLYFPLNLQVPICIVVAGICTVPAWFCGWIAPYNMPFEKFAKTFIDMNILSSKNRKYQTKNSFDEFRNVPKKYTNKELKDMKKQRKKEEKELGEDFIEIH